MTSDRVNRFESRYEFALDPPNTPIEPWNRLGTHPALSSASQAHSRKKRCCGSMISASRPEMPKNSASKRSTSSSTAPALTTPGCTSSSVSTWSPSISSSVNARTDSAPEQTFSHSSSTLAASGKRPAAPTMAISSIEASSARLWLSMTPPHAVGAAKVALRRLYCAARGADRCLPGRRPCNGVLPGAAEVPGERADRRILEQCHHRHVTAEAFGEPRLHGRHVE